MASMPSVFPADPKRVEEEGEEERPRGNPSSCQEVVVVVDDDKGRRKEKRGKVHLGERAAEGGERLSAPFPPHYFPEISNLYSAHRRAGAERESSVSRRPAATGRSTTAATTTAARPRRVSSHGGSSKLA